jgi:hypothetical protein
VLKNFFLESFERFECLSRTHKCVVQRKNFSFLFTTVPFKTPCRLLMNGTILIKMDFAIYGGDEGSPWEYEFTLSFSAF